MLRQSGKEQQMSFEELISLLQANQNEADWGHIEINNVWISYCLADVNVRLEFQLIWQQRKPFMSFQLNYIATPVLAFSIPVAGAQNSIEAFKGFLAEAPKRMRAANQ
jgi:hypothetical protein